MDFLFNILENTTEAIIACDTTGKLNYLNKKAREILGDDYTDGKSERWPERFDLFDFEGKRRLKKEEVPLYRALHGEVVKNFKLSKLRKDQTTFYGQSNARPLFDASGNIIGAMACVQDITQITIEHARLSNLNQELKESVSKRATDLKLSEQNLMKFESRFKTIFFQSPFSIQIASPDGKIILVNQAWQKLWGLDDDMTEVVMKDYNLLEDETLKEKGAHEKIIAAINGEVSEVEEHFYCNPNFFDRPSKGAWIETVIYPLKNELGEVKEIVITHNDITDKRLLNYERDMLLKELSLERNKLQTILRQLPAGVIVVDESSRPILWNTQIEKILGVNFNCFNPSRDCPIAEALSKKEPVSGREVRFIRPDGKEINITLDLGPVHDEENNISASVIICMDNTEKNREKQTQIFFSRITDSLLSTLNYEKLLEQVAAGAIPFLADGCFVDTLENGQIKRLITRHSNERIEKILWKIKDKYPPQINSNMPTSRVIRTGEPLLIKEVNENTIFSCAFNEEHAELLRALELRSVLTTPIQIRGESIGTINFLINSDRPNFTEKDLAIAKELSRRASIAIDNARLFRNAQSAIKLRDDFISIASHELKTPITSLKLQLEVITRSLGSPDTTEKDFIFVKKCAHNSSRQLDRLTRLVDDMLDIARISTGKLQVDMKKTNFTLLLKEVLDRFSEQLKDLGIPIKMKLEENVTLHCDPYRIEQVVTNLISNAVRYGAKRPIEIQFYTENRKGILKVRDEGLGIPKNDFDRIFERFERSSSARHINGLGIGLYISREIIEQHGGRIYAESELNKGSVFTLELNL